MGFADIESLQARPDAEHAPSAHCPGLVLHGLPGGQTLQMPLTHVPPPKHALPLVIGAPSSQTGLPELHAVTPWRHRFMFVPQAAALTQGSQVPALVHTTPKPQVSPAARTTVGASTQLRDGHTVTPAWHGFGLLLHEALSVQPPSRDPASESTERHASRQNRSAQHWAPEGQVPSGSQAN